jgi:hypothetical protein
MVEAAGIVLDSRLKPEEIADFLGNRPRSKREIPQEQAKTPKIAG